MTTIKLRRGTQSEWDAANPVLAEGEQGYVTDTGEVRAGDGSTSFADLPPILSGTYAESADVIANVYRSGKYAFPGSRTSASTQQLGNGRVCYVALALNKARSIDRIACEVTAAGTAGSEVRLGAYGSDATLQPTSLLFDAGTIDSTTTGVKEITVAQTIGPGIVWLAIAVQGSPSTDPTLAALPGGNSIVPIPAPTVYFTQPGASGYVNSSSNLETGALSASAKGDAIAVDMFMAAVRFA